MKRGCIVVLLGLFQVIGFSQKKADTLRLYFAINEVESQHNFLRIDSAVKALNGALLDVGIFGYADFLNSDEYNVTLSQNRAKSVKAYLQKKAAPSQMNFYACEGKGEKFSKDNSSPEGEPRQRRVDVYFEPITIINISEARLQDPQPITTEPGKEKPKTRQDIKPKEQTPAEKNKKMEDLNAGESIALEGLVFEPGRHILRKESIEPLKKLLTTMQDNKTLKIEIQGHVCCIGTDLDGNDFDTHENRLSENRAHAIYSYLVAKGIDSSRVSYKGFGGSQPKIWPEKTFEDQQANRRVEIKVLEK
jgi:outer membrane protein OmpA-like peptidoglycan-associated protein